MGVSKTKRYTTTDCRKLTAVKVITTNSPLYKLTFFPNW